MRQSVRRLATISVSTLALAACESTLDVSTSTRLWGFIQHSASINSSGAYVTSPTGQFFRGALSSIPDARVRPDSCVELFNAPQNPLNVTYLDAGPSITAQFGSRIDTIPRVSAGSRTTYELLGPRTYRPGDSLIVRIPGAAGGFPAAQIRAKTAEPFTVDSFIARPSPAAVQIRWTPATDPNSAMLMEFRYSSTGGSTFNQLIRCAFVDDGADSIPYRIMQPWLVQGANARLATYTRLRTSIDPLLDGFLEVISTFTVPTPQVP